MVRTSETEELEVLINRYADGDETLTPAERQRIETELDRSAEANELLASEHRLTDLLRTADPVPNINYDLLATRISAAIPQSPAAVAEREKPVTASRSFWSMPKLALAASLLIAGGVAIPLLMNDGASPVPPLVTNSTGPVIDGSDNNAIAVTTIRAVDDNAPFANATAEGTTTNVTVGPSPALVGRPTGSQYGLRATTNPEPSRVIITPQSENGSSEGPLSPR